MSEVREKKRTVVILLLLGIVSISLIPAVAQAFIGYGGYVSERSLGNGTGEPIWVSNSTGEIVMLGICPAVTTTDYTCGSVGGVVTATLTGEVINLRGMPIANVWFEWGYSEFSLTNTTPIVTVSATGVQTATINPAPNRVVYYRFCASTDGPSSGSTRSFISRGLFGASYWLMSVILPAIIALAILIAVLVVSGSPLLALLGSIIGLVAFKVVEAIVNSML